MPNYLFKKAKIIDPKSSYNGDVKDVLIENGVITKIDDHIPEKDYRVITSGNLNVSVGWADVGTFSGEPGFEHKETFASLIAASANGGFTLLAIQPNTYPVLDNASVVETISRKSGNTTTKVIPIGAVTKSLEGNELTEMIDMHSSGVQMFSEGDKTVFHTGILLKALQYSSKFNGVIIQKPYDEYLSRGGLVHEGIYSTKKGLKGIPSIAEEIAIQKDLDVLKYAGGRLHFHNISTEESVALIKKAKKDGLKVTCDVSSKHLLYTDEVNQEIDSNYKVFPPYRLEKDRQALIKGVKNGDIDCIVTAHNPQDEDSKKLEFDLAEFGSTGLETFLSELLLVLDIEKVIASITVAPRKLIGEEVPTIKQGEKAELTFFDPDIEWTYEGKYCQSKSTNSPFYNKQLKGKVVAVVNGSNTKVVYE